jgi:hypothetical protein
MTLTTTANGTARPDRFPVPPDDDTTADVHRVHLEAIARVRARKAAQAAGQPSENISDGPATPPTASGKVSEPLPAPTEPQHPPPPRPRPKGKPGRKPSTRLVTCDQRPGETLTLQQAAELAGTDAARVYNEARRGNRCYGFLFRFAPGHEPSPRPPRHEPDPRKAGQPPAPSKGKPGRPPKSKGQNVPLSALAGGTLTGPELARLAVALSEATRGSFCPGDAEQVFSWAAHVQAEYSRLRAILDGRAALALGDGRVDADPIV